MLSDIGVGEAVKCGRALKDAGFQFDLAFTSFLTRPQQTLEKARKSNNRTSCCCTVST